MLIKFKSEQSGDFVMMSDVALPLLKLMGTGGKTEGAVSEQALHRALQQLEKGLQQQTESTPTTHDEDEDEEEATVALSTRAAPLLAMLRKAAAEDGYVMWQEDS